VETALPLRPDLVVAVDDVGVLVVERAMAVRVAVGFGSFPAFVFVGVVRVMNMQVFVGQGLVPVRQFARILGRPEGECGGGRGQGHHGKHGKGNR
jgi:hypothetical protein